MLSGLNDKIDTHSNYQLNKLNYRISQTLTGSNQNITTSNIYHNISNVGGDIYTFDYSLTNNKLSIVSTSVEDTITGTGIRIILVGGVDQNYDQIQEVIVLNGTTPVLSAGNFQMINTMSILSVGSYRKSVGQININTSNNSNIHAIIPIDGSSILTGRYTVANGYTAYLDTLVLTCTSNDTLDVGTFIVSKTFPLQQKASILLYQNIYSSPSLSFVSVPSKFTILYAAKRLSSNPTKVSVNQRIKLIGNSEIV